MRSKFLNSAFVHVKQLKRGKSNTISFIKMGVMKNASYTICHSINAELNASISTNTYAAPLKKKGFFVIQRKKKQKGKNIRKASDIIK